MAVSEEKMRIVINNYFKSECNVDTSIREAFEKGFRIGVKKGQLTSPGKETERKTGMWIYDSEPYPFGNPYGHYDCDQCGESVPTRTNYCQNCGAKMIGGDENA